MGSGRTRSFLGLQGNALRISITELIHDSGNHLVMSFWSLYVLHLGGSIAILALFSILSGFFNVVFQLLLGYLSDRVGRKKPVVWGGFIAALGPLLLAVAPNWFWLIPGTIINSLDSGLWSARQALFADAADPEKRGASVATFYTIFGLTSFFFPALGGLLLDGVGIELGFRLGLVYAGSAKIVQSAGNAMFLEEEKHHLGKEPQQVPSEVKPHAPSLRRLILGVFDPVIGNRTLQVMMMAQSLISIGTGLISRFTIVYAVEFIGLTKTEWGLATSFSNLVNTVLRIPLGMVADRYNRKQCILIGSLVESVYPLLFYHIQSFLQVVLLNTLNAMGANLFNMSWQALSMDATPTSKRGRLYGAFGAISGHGGLLASASPSLGAAMWDAFGPMVPFYATAVLRSASAIFMLVFLQVPRIRES